MTYQEGVRGVEGAMVAWVELVVVLVAVGGGLIVGRLLGRSRGWWVGFGVGLLLVMPVMVGHRSVRMSFVWPMCWAVWPRTGVVVMGVAVPLMMESLAVRLGMRRQRVMVRVLMGAMVLYFAVMPLVLPLAVRGSLLGTGTKVDKDGVCWQQHAYTCGPAAGVTCLGVLGVRGEEGAMGVAARAAPGMGADGWMLASAVEALYGAKGVKCGYRYVGRLEELRVPAAVSIWSPEYGGHYLAVLGVEKEAVVVGDPLGGKYRMGRAEFLREWGGAGVAFERIP